MTVTFRYTKADKGDYTFEAKNVREDGTVAIRSYHIYKVATSCWRVDYGVKGDVEDFDTMDACEKHARKLASGGF